MHQQHFKYTDHLYVFMPNTNMLEKVIRRP